MAEDKWSRGVRIHKGALSRHGWHEKDSSEERPRGAEPVGASGRLQGNYRPVELPQKRCEPAGQRTSSRGSGSRRALAGKGTAGRKNLMRFHSSERGVGGMAGIGVGTAIVALVAFIVVAVFFAALLLALLFFVAAIFVIIYAKANPYGLWVGVGLMIVAALFGVLQFSQTASLSVAHSLPAPLFLPLASLVRGSGV